MALHWKLLTITTAMAAKTLYLVDASIYIFRSYFAMPDTIRNANGHPANAVYGYASFLGGLLGSSKPSHVAAMFDESLGTCFRNYGDYKSNRALPDPDLERQLNWCRELTELVGIRSFASNRYEADDLIGTAAHRLRPHGFRMVYVSGDKDISQLVERQDRLWDFSKDESLRAADVGRRFGVKPAQLADLLGLAGDAVDSIPGVPGIGSKTAARLLVRFGNIEKLFDFLESKSLADAKLDGLRGLERIESLLREHEAQARVSKQLATISRNANIRPTPKSVELKPVKQKALSAWLEENGFGDRLASRLKV